MRRVGCGSRANSRKVRANRGQGEGIERAGSGSVESVGALAEFSDRTDG